MTTTNTFQGMDLDKPSSRVLRPPGGGSSNIFGAADPTPAPPPKKNETQDNVFGESPKQPPPPTRKEDTEGRIFGDKEGVRPPPSSSSRSQQDFVDHWHKDGKDQATNDAPAFGPKSPAMKQTQGSYNILTGQAYPDTPEAGDGLGVVTARGVGPGRNRGAYNPITGIPYPGKEQECKQLDLENTPHKVDRMRATYNPITGEDYGSSQGSQPVHTSTRVKQPPGGASTKLW